MEIIRLLDKSTIDKIAAGEVVDRPASVVKELCENSIDAGASFISVEIEEGGTKLIRITDDGHGIDPEQVKNAFLRHSTSKIRNSDDLSFIHTLGFRGEALSSIAAVSHLELYTKTKDHLTGVIYRIDGGEENSLEEAGLPEGTTILVKDLFYNTPARLKFLKTPRTEAGYISDIMEKLALSHPDIAFKFTSNHSIKLATSGNGRLKDAVYAVYGRDITNRLLEVDEADELLSVKGYIGEPSIARGNRTFETYFINGRYIRDKVVEHAIEEAYKGFQMKGTFPFVVLDIRIEPELIDVNVHPSKMEIRFFDNERVFLSVKEILAKRIREHENIPQAALGKEDRKDGNEQQIPAEIPEPFEKERTMEFLRTYSAPEGQAAPRPEPKPYSKPERNSYIIPERKPYSMAEHDGDFCVKEERPYHVPKKDLPEEQTTLFHTPFLSEQARKKHRIAGEIFDTYWIVEYDDQVYFIDQHAAHEKVLYEEFMNKIKSGKKESQNIFPALILHLDHKQEEALLRFLETFSDLGFVIEPFGDKDYAVSAVPTDLFGLNTKDKFILMLDELSGTRGGFSSEVLADKVATASCKAAVKGGDRLSFQEADALIDKLLKLDNPYNCPHGRPTIITMSKNELERKFKRLI